MRYTSRRRHLLDACAAFFKNPFAMDWLLSTPRSGGANLLKDFMQRYLPATTATTAAAFEAAGAENLSNKFTRNSIAAMAVGGLDIITADEKATEELQKIETRLKHAFDDKMQGPLPEPFENIRHNRGDQDANLREAFSASGFVLDLDQGRVHTVGHDDCSLSLVAQFKNCQAAEPLHPQSRPITMSPSAISATVAKAAPALEPTGTE